MAVEHAQLRKARRLLRQLGHGLVDFDEGNFSALKEQWSKETDTLENHTEVTLSDLKRDDVR
jgi:hypothetical protein